MKSKPESNPKSNPNIKESDIRDTDETVQKMIEEWDIVICAICGAKISLFHTDIARTISGREVFVCKKHH